MPTHFKAGKTVKSLEVMFHEEALYQLGMCGIHFLNFGSVSVRFLKKNSDSVRNEFGSVRVAKTRFGSDSYLLLT